MNYRKVAYIAVFGALWGLWEMSAGSVVHALNLPVKGVIMSSVGIFILLVGRTFVPEAGSSFTIGAIAATLKIFSFGGIVLSPFLAILIESSLAEIFLTLTRSSLSGYIFAGGTAVMWSPLHRLLIQGLIFSSRIYEFYLQLLKQASRLLHIPESRAILLFVAYLLFLFILGSLVGLAAYFIGRTLKREVR